MEPFVETQILSPLRARKLHMTGRVLDPEQSSAPIYRLLTRLGLEPRTRLPGKIVRVEQYQCLDEIKPVGKELLFAVLSDNTQAEGMLGIFVDAAVSRHKLLGWYYGYPDCCVAEYEGHAQERHRRVPYAERGFTKKRQYLAPRRDTPPGGFYPCWECIERGDYETHIHNHRRCQTPFPDNPDDGIAMPEALLLLMDTTNDAYMNNIESKVLTAGVSC